jgi:hypothetical protein
LRASGTHLRRPNLFLIAAIKSDSPFLSPLLDPHCAIYIDRPAGPGYFVALDKVRVPWPRMWEQGYWQIYVGLFEPGGDALPSGFDAENVTPEGSQQLTSSGRLLHRMRRSHRLPSVPKGLRVSTKPIISKRARRKDVDTRTAAMFLQRVQRPHTEKLTAMVGQDFPEWTTVWGGASAA